MKYMPPNLGGSFSSMRFTGPEECQNIGSRLIYSLKVEKFNFRLHKQLNLTVLRG